MDIKSKILGFMREEAYNPLKQEELLKALDIREREFKKEFIGILEEMEEEGTIIKTKKNKYGVPERMNLAVGILQGHQKGFGFVIPSVGNLENDIFIPPDSINGAMNNDKVVVRITKKALDSKRIEGEIIRILKRANKTLVGTFESSRNFGFVVADDQRINQDIFIPKTETLNAKNDYKVVVEITEYPGKKRNPEGRIVEVLGHKNDVGTDVLSIIRKFDLPEEFPKEVLKQIEKTPDEIREEDIGSRRDLRDERIFTIDGSDAKDLDDAISIEKLTNGNFLLGVHIADVSHYVYENSPLDKEALSRGTSVYLVDRVIPMLPPKLSNGICSLHPGVDRLTLSCFMEINNKGKVEKHEIVKSVINSKERVTYEDVTKILEDEDPELIERYSNVVEDFRIAEELALILRNQRRLARGAIDFDFDEAKILLDEDGDPIDIVRYERKISNKMIEEFMLVCNETIAEHMHWTTFPFIYRVHEEPNEEKIKDYNEFIHNLGYRLRYGDEIHPKDLQKLLDKIKGKPEENLISRLMLRTMQQARYMSENLGHFGLAAKNYTHFTSPIRRYPDLAIHRIISEMLSNKLDEKRIEKLSSKTSEMAQQSSVRERVAEQAERETNDLKMAEYMSRRVGQTFSGIISGVTSFGMFIELENTIEGLVRVSSMEDDYYQYDEKFHQFVGERSKKVYKLGQEVTIEVDSVNIPKHEINFVLVEE